MQKRIAKIAVFFSVLALSTTGHCLEKNVDVAANLKANFPNMQFSEINDTPVKGMYEVVTGNNIIYYVPETGNLIFGEVWSKDGKSFTDITRQKLVSKKLSSLPLDKAVKIGNGKNVVIEVTDPDCPFCRKASDFFEKRKDVTRYVFMFPLAQLHPNAEKKARFILSSKDQSKAYKEVMSGKYDQGGSLPAFSDNNLVQEHQKVAAMLGVKGTPNFWINGNHIGGADFAAIEKLLN
ncbi:MAG: hypothetical protein ACD_74C00155G0009 [uncultured bacterium]|nr:MAG: hypothetical protein ACD_74C00155G0009 [uncultured bacterium]